MDIQTSIFMDFLLKVSFSEKYGQIRELMLAKQGLIPFIQVEQVLMKFILLLKKAGTALLVLALFCGLMGLVAYFTIGLVIRSSSEIEVPELVGMDIVNALQRMEGRELKIRIAGFEYSENLPQNRVLFQDPEPGHVVKAGREIRLVLSRGEEDAQIPDLKGLRWEEAVSVLDRKELGLGKRSLLYHENVAMGHVIATDPPFGSWIPKKSAVNFLVSLGKRPVMLLMPDLRGMRPEEMMELLSKMGLRVTDIQSADKADVPLNRVAEQFPAAGSAIPIRSGVRVVIRRSPSMETPGDMDFSSGLRLVRYRLPHSFVRSYVHGNLRAWGATIPFADDVFHGNSEVFVLIPETTEAHIEIEENGVPVFEAYLDPFKAEPRIFYSSGPYGYPLGDIAEMASEKDSVDAP